MDILTLFAASVGEVVREAIAWALMVAGAIFAIWFAGWKAKITMDRMYVPRKDHEELAKAFERFQKRTSDDNTLRKKEGARMERLIEALERHATK